MSKSKLSRRANNSKFTPARAAVAVAMLGQGCTYRTAATAAGIHESTLRDWRRRGDYYRSCGETEHELAQFAEQCDLAEAGVLRELETAVHKAARGDWRAASWLLKTRVPEQYSEKESRAFAERIIDAVLQRIGERCSEEVYDQVLDALSDHIEVDEAD